MDTEKLIMILSYPPANSFTPGEPAVLMRLAADEIKRLRNEIDCACNALTDSINCSGNDARTNKHLVRKLRRVIDDD